MKTDMVFEKYFRPLTGHPAERFVDFGSGLFNAVEMRNITVTVDDEIYHRSRVRAAELQTSLSAMVRKFLVDVASKESKEERLKRLEKETLARIRARGEFAASKRLSREQLHDRHALR